MITCNLMGGLGNQLFQLFFALLGMEKNKKGFFFISDSALLSYKTQRTLEIDNLLNCCKSYISPIIIKSDLLLKLRLPKHLKYFFKLMLTEPRNGCSYIKGEN